MEGDPLGRVDLLRISQGAFSRIRDADRVSTASDADCDPEANQVPPEAEMSKATSSSDRQIGSISTISVSGLRWTQKIACQSLNILRTFTQPRSLVMSIASIFSVSDLRLRPEFGSLDLTLWVGRVVQSFSTSKTSKHSTLTQGVTHF